MRPVQTGGGLLGLLDEIENASARRNLRLRVDEILDELDTEDNAALLKALRDRRYTHRQIARALNNRGHEVSASSILKWRERDGTR